jgi:predicted AlkP superfamily phosphohydrolase/phosphomutase
MRKTLIIGIDGLGYSDLGRYTQYLTCLKDKKHTELINQPPFISSALWTSMFTGVLPGKHGVFDFFQGYMDKGYFQKPVSSNNIKKPRLWNSLNNADIKTGIINIPVTYPINELDGVGIASVMCPDINTKGFKYPLDLEVAEDYIIDINLLTGDPTTIISDMIDARCKLALKLIDEFKDINFWIVTFVALDRILHLDYDSNKINEPTIKVLNKINESLMKLLELEFDNIYFTSDHGFMEIKEYFALNNWLVDNGYMVLKSENADVTIDKLNEQWTYIYGKVDWKKTKAYCVGKRGSLVLNMKNREPQGIVTDPEPLAQEIKKKLLDERMIDNVLEKEVLHPGPYCHLAPDLTVIPKNHGCVVSYLMPELSGKRPERLQIGIEHGNSIFISEKIDKRKGIICDVTPTILDLYRIPILPGLDGKSLLR